MFRHAYRKSRVLIPADAFYEWTPKDGKQPYLVRLRDGEPMGMGSLLEHWQGAEGDVTTFTILTVDANSLMAKIHDRMPVIIRPEDYAAWLDTNLTDVIKIQAMVQPYPDRFMEAYPVSRKVNSPQQSTKKSQRFFLDETHNRSQKETIENFSVGNSEYSAIGMSHMCRETHINCVCKVVI